MSTQFPAGIDAKNVDLYEGVNKQETTLTADLTIGATTAYVNSITGFPTAGGLVWVENELIKYTGVASDAPGGGPRLTGVTRAVYGTDTLHASGASVELRISAQHITNLVDAVIAIETLLGVNGATFGKIASTQTWTGQNTFSNATAPIITAKLGPSSTQQHALPAVTSSTIAVLGAAQTWSAVQTFSQPPVISSFSSAQHDHTNSAGGGVLNFATATSGTVGVTRGGLGLTSVAAGEIPYGSGVDTYGKIAAGTNTQVLIGGATPAWGSVNLSTMVTGTLGIGSGGTGATTASTARAALSAAASGANTDITSLAGLTTALGVAYGGTGFLGGYALGQILYADGASSLARLAGNTTATKLFLTQTGNGSVSAAPAWAGIVAGDIPNLDVAKITTGVFSAARGGTGFDSYAQGNLLYADSTTTLAKLAPGTATQLLIGGTTPSWGAVDLATAMVTGILPGNKGGTGTQYVSFSGPTANRTYTLPDATSIILTTNALVTAAQGGTGFGTGATYTVGQILYADGATSLARLTAVATGNVLISGGVATAPAWGKVTNSHIDTAAAIAWSKIDKTGALPSDISAAAQTITISTSNGLSGGGDLTSNRTLSWDGVKARLNSAGSVYTRRRLNFIEGSGISITVGDDAANDEIDVTIISTATLSSLSWSALTNPTDNLTLSMGARQTTFSYNSATGAGVNLFNFVDSASNTGTGYLVSIETAASSNLKPFRLAARGTDIVTMAADGTLTVTKAPAFNPSTATAPFTTNTTVVVANLNADLLDGQEGAYYLNLDNATSTLAVTKGGTGLTSYVLGNIIYADGVSSLAKLAPNTSMTRNFLSMTGSGSAGAAPAWVVLAESDVPSLGATKITSGTFDAARIPTLAKSKIDSTGTWTAAEIPSLDAAKITTGFFGVTRGGTGLNTVATGAILYANATDSFAALAAGTSSQVLVGGASAPSWGSVSLTTMVSGILPTANGGTNNAFFAVSGPTTSVKTFTFPNASATVLTSDAAVTTAQGGTGLTSYTAGDMLYYASGSTLTKLAAGAANNVLLSGTAPSWGKVSLTSMVSNVLPGANGGTENGFMKFAGPTTTTKTFTLPDATATLLATTVATWTAGDMFYTTSTSPTALSRLQSVATGSVLVSAGAGSAPAWSATPGILTSLAIGQTGAAAASAVLELVSTSKGFLPSRMTRAQRDAISAVDALMVFNTDTKQLQIYQNSHWDGFAGENEYIMSY